MCSLAAWRFASASVPVVIATAGLYQIDTLKCHHSHLKVTQVREVGPVAYASVRRSLPPARDRLSVDHHPYSRHIRGFPTMDDSIPLGSREVVELVANTMQNS
jgi:hypothetical protein